MGRCSSINCSNRSTSTPSASMGAPISWAPYKRKHWIVAKKVGASTITLSPGEIMVFPIRSNACWLPVVTIKPCGVTVAPLAAMNRLICSRKGSHPSVAPYCNTGPGLWVITASVAIRSPSTSNKAGSGKPPAKLIIPGLPRSLNSSRMAEVSIWFKRSANCKAMVYLSRWCFFCIVALVFPLL